MKRLAVIALPCLAISLVVALLSTPHQATPSPDLHRACQVWGEFGLAVATFRDQGQSLSSALALDAQGGIKTPGDRLGQELVRWVYTTSRTPFEVKEEVKARCYTGQGF